MKILFRLTLILSFLLLTRIPAGAGAQIQTGNITGFIIDKNTKEPLTGAIVSITAANTGTVANYDGSFEINGLNPGSYSIQVNCLAYLPQTFQDVEVRASQSSQLNVEMEEEVIRLREATVYGQRKLNTDLAVITSMKTLPMVVSAVSTQQISRTQDRDASEVIKRVPGISIIENKFVIVRGLSQRYNNVWINGGGVPSSEADTRSFSFDIIPSSQIDNVTIIKSPSPEYPADFSGGFISIKTKDIPGENAISVNVGTGLNDRTFGHDFLKAKGGSTDFLGFDDGFRGLKLNADQRLNNNDKEAVTRFTREGFNNDWSVRTKNPMPDIRLGISGNYTWKSEETGRQLGLLAAINYSHANRSYLNVENSRFGIWNTFTDEATYVNSVWQKTPIFFKTQSKICIRGSYF